MANIIGSGFLADKGQVSAWLKNTFLHIVQRFKPLLTRGCFQLCRADELFLESIYADSAIFDEHVGMTFHELIDPLVPIEKATHKIIYGQQRGGADYSAADAVIVADDGVLHGIGKRQQHDQIEGIQLYKFTFAREAQADNQKSVYKNWPKNLFGQRQAKNKHILPDDVMHFSCSSGF